MFKPVLLVRGYQVEKSRTENLIVVARKPGSTMKLNYFSSAVVTSPRRTLSKVLIWLVCFATRARSCRNCDAWSDELLFGDDQLEYLLKNLHILRCSITIDYGTVMGMQVMDSQDGLETHQYTFGGLADCYQQFIMDISGAAEIPVTCLFGRSLSGLNATGESDLQNYYDMIAEKQESYLRPILNKVLPPFIISTLGSLPDDFDFEFDPVAEPSDKERADLAKCGTDNVVAAYNAGLISQRTALKELKQQSERTGVWTNITDEDIERASDTVEDSGEMGGMMPDMDFGGEEQGEQARAPVRQGEGQQN